jgi:hypothetical protein
MENYVGEILLSQQRLSDCVRANPFFFLRRKKNGKKERAAREMPP